jgi:hypothetical protein
VPSVVTMTMMTLRWIAARPRRRFAWTRRLGALRRPGAVHRPARRAYYDSFFADPTAVEDDRYRMSRRTRG